MSETSPSIRQAVQATLAGHSVIMAGPADALAVHRGTVAQIRQQVHHIGGPRDVIVRVCPEGLTVLHGMDRWTPPASDPVVAAAQLLRHEELSALVILDGAEFLLQSPELHDEDERRRVGALQRGLADGTTHGRLRNVAVMLTASVDGIPRELRSGVDRIKVVTVGGPATISERRVLFDGRLGDLHGTDGLCDADRASLLGDLVWRTEGMTLCEVNSMIEFSAAARIAAGDPARLIRRYRFGLTVDPWADLDLRRVLRHVQGRVQGQDDAVVALASALADRVVGLDMSGGADDGAPESPASLLLVGPTGVGKTLFASAVNEAVFGGTARDLVYIDFSTYKESQNVERLVGSSPGYVGFGQGGQLTEPALSRPFGVILIDEYEKAHPHVHDYLMRVLDAGALTDGAGRVADFGNWIILCTSNLGLRRRTEQALGIASPGAVVDLATLSPDESRASDEESVYEYFTEIGRPELAGRWAGSVVSFQPLRDEDIYPITRSVIDRIGFRRGPKLDVNVQSAADWMGKALTDPISRAYGGRFIRNAVRGAFRQLAAWTVLTGRVGSATLDVRFDPDGGMHVAADGDPAVTIDPGHMLHLILQEGGA